MQDSVHPLQDFHVKHEFIIGFDLHVKKQKRSEWYFFMKREVQKLSICSNYMYYIYILIYLFIYLLIYLFISIYYIYIYVHIGVSTKTKHANVILTSQNLNHESRDVYNHVDPPPGLMMAFQQKWG